jgi:hypothetical protein
LKLTLSLLSLPVQRWTGTVTTGATSSNVLALACGRDAVLKRAMAARGHADWDMAEDGLADAPAVTVYVALPHASIKKAAAIVGIGRARVVDLGQRVSVADSATAEQLARARAAALDFDLDALEVRLAADSAAKQGAIVVVGMSEVNTGALAAQTPALRQLCDRYGAWLHIDAAFGAFASLVPGFEWVAEHLNLADSITSDAHKQLNVRHAQLNTTASMLTARSRCPTTAASCSCSVTRRPHITRLSTSSVGRVVALPQHILQRRRRKRERAAQTPCWRHVASTLAHCRVLSSATSCVQLRCCDCTASDDSSRRTHGASVPCRFTPCCFRRGEKASASLC